MRLVFGKYPNIAPTFVRITVAYENVILVVIAIAVVIFGAKRIPELAKSLGRAKGEYEKGKKQVQQELDSALKLDPRTRSSPPE